MGSKNSKLEKQDLLEEFRTSPPTDKPPSYTAAVPKPKARFERRPTPTVILEFISDDPEEILLATSAALADLTRRGIISELENTVTHMEIWREYNKAMRNKLDMSF